MVPFASIVELSIFITCFTHKKNNFCFQNFCFKNNYYFFYVFAEDAFLSPEDNRDSLNRKRKRLALKDDAIPTIKHGNGSTTDSTSTSVSAASTSFKNLSTPPIEIDVDVAASGIDSVMSVDTLEINASLSKSSHSHTPRVDLDSGPIQLEDAIEINSSSTAEITSTPISSASSSSIIISPPATPIKIDVDNVIVAASGSDSVVSLGTLEMDASLSTSSRPPKDDLDYGLNQLEDAIRKFREQIQSLEKLRLDVLKDPIKQLKSHVKALEISHRNALLLIGSLKTKVKTLEEKCSSVSSDLKKFEKIFTKEQISLVAGQIAQPRQWSDRAIQTGIEIRFKCGSSGYEHLRKLGFPFPCVSSLLSRLALMELSPGTSITNLQLLSIMLDSMEQTPGLREACLSYDEMHINSQLEYHPGIQQIVGYITIPTNKLLAAQEKQDSDNAENFR